MSEEQSTLNEPPAFDPTAELEYLLAGAKQGKVSIITVYQALLRAPLYAMFDRMVDPANPDSSANALLFETEDMGKLMVLFTAPGHADRIRSDLGNFAHPGQLSGEYVVGSLDEDTGIIMNPGYDFGMKLSAQGLQKLKADFGILGGPQGSTGASGMGDGGPQANTPGSFPGGGTPFPELN